MTAHEVEANFDGLVGLTHHYGGLSYGNLASMGHRGLVADPRAAALQGLRKMRHVMQLGIPQGVLPPQLRPDLPSLRRLGFGGSNAEVLERAGREDPQWLTLASSASAMWAANAATVCPSRDAQDGRVHFTVANLSSMFHRSLEASGTYALLSHLFGDTSLFAVHPALPSSAQFGDEGAANHTRLVGAAGAVQLFGFGRRDLVNRESPAQAQPPYLQPRVHPARQSLEASRAVARLNQVRRPVFWQQDPEGIDAGAFHSDVLCVGHRTVFLIHEKAFLDTPGLLATLLQQLGEPMTVALATDAEFPLADAVASYAFNSQLVSDAQGALHLIAPTESRDNAAARRFLESLQGQGTIEQLHYLNVKASMNNGGGPACLRLRVSLTEAERAAVRGRVWLDDTLYHSLEQWVLRHYRDRLTADDLADPELLQESYAALDELTRLLDLGSLYDFQRVG